MLSEQFINGLCKEAKYRVQIIEKTEGAGRTDEGTMGTK